MPTQSTNLSTNLTLNQPSGEEHKNPVPSSSGTVPASRIKSHNSVSRGRAKTKAWRPIPNLNATVAERRRFERQQERRSLASSSISLSLYTNLSAYSDIEAAEIPENFDF